MSRFSHRNGYKELPSQLELGKISTQFRTRILLAFNRLIENYTNWGATSHYLNKDGRKIFENYWIKELRETQNWEANLSSVSVLITRIINRSEFWNVFDTIEFFVEHTSNPEFTSEITAAFVDERLAYRFKDNQIVAVGTEEQAKTIDRAFETLETSNMEGSATHLKQSSRLLAQGDFGGSVRESIAAVESVARKIEPSANTLGEALNKIHKSKPNVIHPALNEAFKKIYGYTSDTEGVRHSFIDETIAPVDESEALFILGACSAFIPYLLSGT